MSKARPEDRLRRIEEDVRAIRVTLASLVPPIDRIDERLAHELPHLATKAELTAGVSDLRAELADKPGKMWLTTAIALLIAAYAAGLAGLAALPVVTKRVQP